MSSGARGRIEVVLGALGGVALAASACGHTAPSQRAPESAALPAASPARASKQPPAAECPQDPERDQQLSLAAPPDPTGWPAEVRLRMRVRADGAIDCIRFVSATREGFVEACRAQIEGKRRAPRRDAAGQPVDQWMTYLCQFEPN